MPKHIDPKHVQVIILLEILGWSHTEISSLVGVHRHTVRNYTRVQSSISTSIDLEENPVAGHGLQKVYKLLHAGCSLPKLHKSVCSFASNLSLVISDKHQLETYQESNREISHDAKKTKICLHCRNKFQPDPRHRKKQQYCSKITCRKTSKKVSQKKWAESKGIDYWKQ